MLRVDVYVDLWTRVLIEWGWRVAAEYCERRRGGKAENSVEECKGSLDRGASGSVHDCYRLTTTIQSRRNRVCPSDELGGITNNVTKASTPSERQSVRQVTIRLDRNQVNNGR